MDTLRLTLFFDENQTKFIRDSQKRMNDNKPKDEKVTELDVIRHLLEAGWEPFSKYIDSLPKKTVGHLSLLK